MAEDLALPMVLRQAGSLLAIDFTSDDESFDVGFRRISELAHIFHVACLNQGLFIADSRELVIGLATCMSDEVVEEATEKLQSALAETVRLHESRKEID